MSQAQLLGVSHKEEWDAYVFGHSDSIAWQLFDWSRLVADHFRGEFLPLGVRTRGEIAGILPLYLVRSRPGKSALISVPGAVAGGILANDDEIARTLLDEAIQIRESRGAGKITLKQYKHPIEGRLRVDDNYFNRELDLGNGPDKIWNAFDDRNRRRVKESLGYDWTLDHASADLDSFYRLLFQQHHRKGIPCAGKAWVRDLLDIGMYSIALLKEGERVVAGTLVKTFKRTVSFPFTCCLGESRQDTLPVYRLYWDLIRKHSCRGFEIFHSGRIPVTEETEVYRLGWGGTRFSYYYQYYPAATATTEFTTKRSGKRVLFQQIWSHLPAPLVRVAGPIIVRQFP